MRPMNSEEVVATFVDFFVKNDHLRIPGASLVPANDPTLLYINSGMAPLKPYFLGLSEPPRTKMCNVQRCIRTNDIEDVGDRHHLTFFEMLGSWSIGDYWKDKAIALAWELLTEGFGFPREKLYATVYKGDPALGIPPDEDSARVWESVGMPADHIVALGEDNFWGPAGEWGPCGPCTEVFFDTGEDFGPAYRPGGHFDDKRRYIEIWNAGVFMQYDKQASGLTPLAIRSVDTGSGVERMVMAMNGFESCYETDQLKPLVDFVTGAFATRQEEATVRILSDHVRSAAMILADGVGPSPSGRGYIPRRLIRRAVAATVQGGAETFDFAGMVELAIDNAKSWNTHVALHKSRIIKTFMQEVADFRSTLGAGLQRLADAFAEEPEMMSASTAFTLYATYGIPIDVTREYVQSRGGKVDVAAFEGEYRRHQELSRGGPRSGGAAGGARFDIGSLPMTGIAQAGVATSHFLGYEAVAAEAKVYGVFVDGGPTDQAREGDEAAIVVDRTPFYAESGGQMGDTGTFLTRDGAEFVVHDVVKSGPTFVHLGVMAHGVLKVGDQVELRVDAERRRQLSANHSATHLMHEALRRILGDHVSQKGSLVAPERLRFDFSHNRPVSAEEIHAVEAEVNARVRENTPVHVEVMAIAEAVQAGALAFFGEKYGDEVRVARIGAHPDDAASPFSIELCGGTHVQRTGDIGLFKIVSEGAVASGVRRIEAVTGAAAEAFVAGEQALLRQTAASLKIAPADLPKRVADLLEERRQLERELGEARRKAATAGVRDQVKDIAGVRFLGAVLDDVAGKDLKGLADEFSAGIGSGVVAILSRSGGKASIVVGVTADLVGRFNAVELVRVGAAELGGKGGGGSPGYAQAGGADATRAEAALEAVEAAIATQAAA